MKYVLLGLIMGTGPWCTVDKWQTVMCIYWSYDAAMQACSYNYNCIGVAMNQQR